MSDPEYTDTTTKSYGIGLWDTENGVFMAEVSGDTFLFGVTCSSSMRGIHIGPFFIGWLAC